MASFDSYNIVNQMRSIGQYKISTLVLEHFALDGGAMFGSVPKTLWSRAITPDDKNRIPLCTRVMVIDGPAGRILIDCGNGDKWGDKEINIYDIAALSVDPVREQIKDVSALILTHLHFDHAGGVTYRDPELKLSYPNATHYLQRDNFERATHPGIRERGSYLPENVQPLQGAKLVLLDGEREIFPGIFLKRSEGHTAGLQWVLIRDSLETVAYPTDLIPTAHHVPIPWLMGYDLRAETTIQEKSDFLRQASDENWLIIFEHDRDTTCGRVTADGQGKYSFVREQADDLAFTA